MTAAASELWNLASCTVKDALRPGTMPTKRKRETKEAMALQSGHHTLHESDDYTHDDGTGIHKSNKAYLSNV